MDKVDTVVIGAGVIGLACAKAMAERGHEVIVLERHGEFGTEISARNSEVIHAGIYYPGGSLKARLCVEGRERLYRYCSERGITHRRCGKLLVATSDGHIVALEALHRQGQVNGVSDLERISADEARVMEPQLHCVAAVHSPSTGIIDSHGLMLALLADAEAHGALLAVNSTVVKLIHRNDGFVLRVDANNQSTELHAGHVINAAGLGAPAIAGGIVALAREFVPTAYFAKGSYYSLQGRAPFSRLIYPLPEPGGLGVHFTLDLGGQARFGPDVEWVETPDYAVDPAGCTRFYHPVRRYWPGLPDGALAPAYAGVRPKIRGPGAPAADFLIQGPVDHGLPGLVNLFGIESPGLTSSLAIADHVAALLR